MNDRLAVLRQLIAPQSQSGLLLTRPTDITHATGFEFLIPLEQEREAYLVITQDSAHLIHASFSPVNPVEGIKLVPGSTPKRLAEVLEKIREAEDVSTFFTDTQTLFVNELQVLQAQTSCNFPVLDREQIWAARLCKSVTEVAALRAACHQTALVMDDTIEHLRVGMTELEVANLLESQLRQSNFLPLSFPTIVCFGAHSALPHHQPDNTPLAQNTPVLIDFGGTKGGYHADMTRTVWFGDQPSATFTQVEQVVLSAYEAAIAAQASRQVTAKMVDKAARDVIEAAGFGAQFIHTTGHGVGLEIHEPPSLSWRNEAELKPGMTITVEPGIYLPGEFGYRFENTVLITETGVENLTT